MKKTSNVSYVVENFVNDLIFVFHAGFQAEELYEAV